MRITREDLYAALWKEPIAKLAAKWCVPAHQIRKASEVWNIPRPRPGHWVKIAHRRVLVPPLPQTEVAATIELRLQTPSLVLPSAIQEELLSFSENTLSGSKCRNHHWAVKATDEAIAATAPHQAMEVLRCRYSMPHLDCATTKATQKRAFRIFDCVLRCAAALNVELVELGKESKALAFKVGDDVFGFSITEKIQRVEATAREPAWLYRKYDFVPTGILEFRFESAFGEKCRWSWKDSKTRYLEDVLEEIVSNILMVANAHKRRREWLAERDRQWAEQHRIRELEQARQEAQQQALESLLKAASRWEELNRARAFLDQVRKSMIGTETTEFSNWAVYMSQVLDGLDPLQVKERLWAIDDKLFGAEWSPTGIVQKR